MRYSTTRLFADDCLMYRNIRSAKDKELLQQEMDHLQIWEKGWLMNFNAPKCQTIHFSRKWNPITKTYAIHGEDLESVDNATYLGVKLNSTAAWGPHCNSTSRKSECTRAFLQRNLAGTQRQIKSEFYKTLPCPILDYASTVWDPHCKSDADKLERTQRRSLCLQGLLPGEQRHCDASHPGRKERQIPGHHDVPYTAARPCGHPAWGPPYTSNHER